MRIGTRTGSIGGDPEDALPLAASLGFAGVEFSISARDPDGNVLAEEAGWELLKRQSAETGVAVCSLCVGSLGLGCSLVMTRRGPRAFAWLQTRLRLLRNLMAG